MRGQLLTCGVLLLTALGGASRLQGQAPASDKKVPAFDVASIKTSINLDAGGTLRMLPGGSFRAVNVDVRNLILSAYRTADRRLFPSQLIGAPSWLPTDRFDITAKVNDGLASRPQAELFGMLPVLIQSLLEDHFKLQLHHETRELPVYVMTLAHRDGHLGPAMHESLVDCRTDPSKCALRFLPGHLTGGSVDMETLTNLIAGPAERVVVDRTPLRGRYEFDLEWSVDQSAPDKPSLFAALQEQLGLKLESARDTLDVLVIDHVERPTPD
jgi:uncharacterized protein (TIGR03435 family)